MKSPFRCVTRTTSEAVISMTSKKMMITQDRSEQGVLIGIMMMIVIIMMMMVMRGAGDAHINDDRSVEFQ